MSKRMIIMTVVLAVLFGGTFAYNAFRGIMIKRYFAKYKPPAAAVSTTKAEAVTWKPSLNAVGTIEAVNGVAVNSQVSGQVDTIAFKSGAMVKKGQLLIQLDDSIEQQSLKNAQAEMRLSKLNNDRQQKLLRTGATSRKVADETQANFLKAQSNVETARLNIEHKKITAPFAGKIGIRKVNVGQYITPGQALVTLQALDPLYVDFYLPEQDLAKIHPGQLIKATVDAYPDKSFSGKITAIDAKINIDTRSVLVRAIIPNKEMLLYPGIFANVDVILPARDKVVTVPQIAVTFSLYGDSVYVIKLKGKDKQGKPILVAMQRYVRVGDRKGSVVQILKGLKAGETVVATGQIKLHNGSKVIINNSLNKQLRIK